MQKNNNIWNNTPAEYTLHQYINRRLYLSI